MRRFLMCIAAGAIASLAGAEKLRDSPVVIGPPRFHNSGAGGAASSTAFYDNTALPNGYVFYSGALPPRVLDDVSFHPGPGGGGANLYTDQNTVSWLSLNGTDADMYVQFWDDVSLADADPVNANFIAGYYVEIRGVPGGAWYSVLDLSGIGGVTLPDDQFGLEFLYMMPGSTSYFNPDYTAIFPMTETGPVVGSSQDIYWRDVDQNGRYNAPPDARYFGGPPFLANVFAAVYGVTGGPCDPCDTNCDGSVNGFDIANFISAMGGTPSGCSVCNSDTNFDGSINGFDVELFILCMAGSAGGDCSCVCSIGKGVVTPGSSVTVQRTITNTGNKRCTFAWTITKASGTPAVNPNPASGSVTLDPGQSDTIDVEMKVPANTPAHDHAVMKLGGTCESTGTICVIPTDENTASNGWDAGGVHKWKQTLQPTTADFTTRVVTEEDPGGGGPDTCHFDGSAYAAWTAITGGTWTVGAANLWSDDYVGWYGAAITYYRDKGKAPCGTTFPQRMLINCPDGNVPYTTNTLKASFTATTVTSERDGQTATRNWP